MADYILLKGHHHQRHYKKRSSNFTGGHHLNDRDKKDDAQLRKAVDIKRTVVEDAPVPLIDIGVERITELIRSITGQFEDAFQDAWVRVIEEHPNTEEEILKIAREVDSQHAIEASRENTHNIDLDKPIGKHKDENDGFTFKELFSAPDEVQSSEDLYIATSTGKVNQKGNVTLDWDDVLAIRKLFPHDTLNVAVRKLIGLPQAERDNRPWYKWEDALIRRRYPWGGARAVMIDIPRSGNAINKRARELGVNAGKNLNSYKPVADWLNIPELADRLSVSYETARKLIIKGAIDSIRIPKYHQGHDGVFVTNEALNAYLDGSPPEGAGRRRKLWRHLKDSESKAKKEVESLKHERVLQQRLMDKILETIDQQHINNVRPFPVVFGFLIDNPKHIEPLTSESVTHYTYQNTDGDWVRACKPGDPIVTKMMLDRGYKPRFVDGFPHCKICLSMNMSESKVSVGK